MKLYLNLAIKTGSTSLPQKGTKAQRTGRTICGFCASCGKKDEVLIYTETNTNKREQLSSH
jgi:hypothetical protein